MVSEENQRDSGCCVIGTMEALNEEMIADTTPLMYETVTCMFPDSELALMLRLAEGSWRCTTCQNLTSHGSRCVNLIMQST
jgi:ribosomal protein L37AE/L43A